MNCIRRFESIARPYFRCAVDDFTSQSDNLAHRFIEKTIELLEESSVAVAHWLNAALQTRKVADYERLRGGQSLCHEIAVLRHVLNQVN